MKSRCRFFLTCLIASLIAVSLVSCGKIGESSNSTDEEELPDMVMTDASYTFGESGRRPVIMSASKITIYSSKADKTVLVDIKFRQEGKNNEIEMEGKCNYAVVTEKNTKAELHGDIHLFKKTDNFSINLSASGNSAFRSEYSSSVRRTFLYFPKRDRTFTLSFRSVISLFLI